MSSGMSSPVAVAMAVGMLEVGFRCMGLCALCSLSPGTCSCAVPATGSSGGWVLVTVRLRLATGPPIDLGGREGAERLSTASFAIALGQGSGKEQREPMEMELLCDREARESMEASGACGHRRSLLHASVLAL